MKKIISVCMIVVVLCTSAMFSTEAGAKIYKENKKYTFKGKIEKKVFYHNNGKKLTSYILKLKKPIKAKSGFSGKVKLKTIDLQWYSKKIKKKIKRKVGKKAKVTGKFAIYASPAWSYSPMTIDVSKIK